MVFSFFFSFGVAKLQHGTSVVKSCATFFAFPLIFFAVMKRQGKRQPSYAHTHICHKRFDTSILRHAAPPSKVNWLIG